MQAFEQLFVDVFHTARDQMEAFKFDRFKNVDRTLAALYATIFEIAESAFALYQDKRYTGAFLMQRPMLEAHVDLLNLAADPGYIEFMEASHQHEWKRLLTVGLKGTNPFLQGYAGNPDAQKAFDEAEKKLKDWKAQGIEPMSVKARFTKANMLEEYESAYNRLCCDTHNNISALQERHFEISADKKDFQLVINGDPGKESINAFLDGLIGNLLTSSYVVHEHFGSPVLDKFAELRKRRDEVNKGA